MAKRTKSQETKQLILQSALKLFNQDGFVNVRLQHIADEAFISVGNLAYHYPNKAAIFEAIYGKITEEQKALLVEFRIVPLFDNIESLIQQTFILQQRYIFFYLDTLEILRAYPEQATAHQRHIRWQEELLKTMIDFNVSRGAFLPELIQGSYEQLGQQLRALMDSWPAQQQIKGNEAAKVEDFSQALWSLLCPLFTETGKQEYLQMRQLMQSKGY